MNRQADPLRQMRGSIPKEKKEDEEEQEDNKGRSANSWMRQLQFDKSMPNRWTDQWMDTPSYRDTWVHPTRAARPTPGCASCDLTKA